MKIGIIRANPRKNGHTQRLTNLFIEGLNQGGAQVLEIDITDKKINQCLGCYTCWLITPGVCLHKDDMSSIMNEFCSWDIVVFSTPLYIYGVSGYLKVFFDRLLPYMKNEHAQASKHNIRNLIRNPESWPKKMAYILTGAFKGLDTFEGARKTFELFAEGLSLPLCGAMIRPETYFLPFQYIKPKTVHQIKASFKKAGIELAQQASIKKETIEKISAPLSGDIKHFVDDSNIYWQEAQRLGKKGQDLDLVSDCVVRNPKILLSEMAKNIDQKSTARIKTKISFKFPDKNSYFTIAINKGECLLTETKDDDADLYITVDSTVWAQIFLRETNAASMIMEKKIALTGDKSLFSRLDKFFPLPFD